MLAEPSSVTHCFSAAQVRALDRYAIEYQGLPGIRLMKRAGRFAFEQIMQAWPHTRRLLVLCGGGNNGGDGFIVAALARQRGIPVKLWAMTEKADLSGDASLAADFAVEAGVSIEQVNLSDIDACFAGLGEDELASETIVVDALLGTGLKGFVRDEYARVIRAVNRSGFPVLAIDIPSGLCSDTGANLGEIVKADLTTTFVGVKRGLLTHLGPEY
ncbi:MAG: NAD(P)H-hydrate epimerase, partial [Pseudomonadales bacterium]|nr:NAD(P)H-hydrate epimerase [Pseudomonadales bacterium]